MSKKYNIGKKTDMQRLHCNITKKIECIAEEKAKSIYQERTQDINFNGTVFTYSKVECPNCHNKVSATVGYKICPNM